MYGIINQDKKVTWFTVNTTSYWANVLETFDYSGIIGQDIDTCNALPDGTGRFFVSGGGGGGGSRKTYLANYDKHYIIGILQASWSATEAKRVAITWQTSVGHSSLQVWEEYYASYDWTLTTDSTTYPTDVWALWTYYGQLSAIWRAFSATEIIVNIPYHSN